MRNYSIAILLIVASTIGGRAAEPEIRLETMPDSLVMSRDSIFFSREPVYFTLRECLQIGLQRNYDIIIEGNNQRITDNNATLGNAGFLPSVDLSSGYSGTYNNTKQVLADGAGTNRNNGVHNPTFNAGVNLNWTIFEGFSVRTTYERLKELQTMGALNTKLVVEDFIAQLTTEYYTYIRQYRRLLNLKDAVSLSMERLRIVEAHYNIGTMSRLDLQQACVDLNSDRSLLIQQYETMHTMRTRLNELLSADDIEISITPADSVIEYNGMLDRERIYSLTMEENVYLEMAEKENDIIQLDLKLVESGRYPYVRLTGGYGYTQNWYGSGQYDRQRNLGFNYGINIGVNLFDGYNQRRRERNARIEVENSELMFEQIKLSLEKALSDAWMSYRNNIQLTRLESDNLTVARENYEIAMERYRLGQLAGIELREAQNSLLEAEERLVQAQYDTKISEITLMNLSGQVVTYLY